MKRSDNLARLDDEYDLLVIGGGATGLGVALDSATRGYRTLLVESHDFAQGTSSRSTKLVHGGVRYLQQGNVRLVREALQERGLLIRNAPHLVSELTFMVPAYRWWEMGFYGVGLKAYDLLAGSLGLRATGLVAPGAARRLVPNIAPEGLRGGILYADAQFNDSRLAMILARTAHRQGAALLNHAPARGLLKHNGRVAGVVVGDTVAGGEREVRARVVVNATGVFTDEIRRLDDPSAEPLLAYSQGIHLVLDRRFLPGETAVMVPHTDDGRVIFIIPWQGKALAGTTDTPAPAPSVEPVPWPEEIDFVLRHLSRYLALAPTAGDVLSAFAGLRPLVRSGNLATAALSRDHTLITSPSGLVTITGGKWTTYRRMAQDTVDAAATVGALPLRPCRTRHLRLYGADCPDPRWYEFGAGAEEIARYETRYPGLLHENLPYTMAMAAYAVDHEMPARLEDLLSRRLRALVLDARAAAEAAPAVAALMAQLQGHGDDWVRKEVAAFRTLAATAQVGTPV